MGNSNSTTQKPKKNVYSEIYDKHHLHNVEMDDDDTFALAELVDDDFEETFVIADENDQVGGGNPTEIIQIIPPKDDDCVIIFGSRQLKNLPGQSSKDNKQTYFGQVVTDNNNYNDDDDNEDEDNNDEKLQYFGQPINSNQNANLQYQEMKKYFPMPRSELQERCDQDPKVADLVCENNIFWMERTKYNFPGDNWNGFTKEDPWMMINFLRISWMIMDENQRKQDPQQTMKYIWEFKNLNQINQYIRRNNGQLDLTMAEIEDLPDFQYLKQAFNELESIKIGTREIKL